MTQTLNTLGQPIGFALPDWTPPPVPPRQSMTGRFCHLEPLDADKHAADLYTVIASDVTGKSWTYLPYGPFENLEGYQAWMKEVTAGNDPMLFAIIDNTDGKPYGITGFLRIDPKNGCIETGHIYFSERLKKSPIATEAMYLMMQRAFELGYRRYEWKCDSFHTASRQAAQRLGFSFEGIFRQAIVYKGRSRDTAWYAAIDFEWPLLQNAFLTWLAPENFDEHGQQRKRLSKLTAPILNRRG